MFLNFPLVLPTSASAASICDSTTSRSCFTRFRNVSSLSTRLHRVLSLSLYSSMFGTDPSRLCSPLVRTCKHKECTWVLELHIFQMYFYDFMFFIHVHVHIFQIKTCWYNKHVFGKCPVWISNGMPSIPTEYICHFPQFFETKSGTLPHIRP